MYVCMATPEVFMNDRNIQQNSALERKVLDFALIKIPQKKIWIQVYVCVQYEG